MSPFGTSLASSACIFSRRSGNSTAKCSLAYVAWYGLGRVWIEGLRTDSLYLFSTGIRVSQLVAAVSFLAAGGVLAWVLIEKKPTPDTLYVNRRRNESQEGEKQAD